MILLEPYITQSLIVHLQIIAKSCALPCKAIRLRPKAKASISHSKRRRQSSSCYSERRSQCLASHRLDRFYSIHNVCLFPANMYVDSTTGAVPLLMVLLYQVCRFPCLVTAITGGCFRFRQPSTFSTTFSMSLCDSSYQGPYKAHVLLQLSSTLCVELAVYCTSRQLIITSTSGCKSLLPALQAT